MRKGKRTWKGLKALLLTIVVAGMTVQPVFAVEMENNDKIEEQTEIQTGEEDLEPQTDAVASHAELTDSSGDRAWSAEPQVIKYHGDEEVKFYFTNGTGAHAIQGIDFVSYGVKADTYICGTEFSSGYTCDMDAGVFIMDDSDLLALKGIWKSNKERGGEKLISAAFTLYGRDSNGVMDWLDVGWLDLTEFELEDLTIIPEATDYEYIKGDSNGVTITCTGAVEDFESVYIDDIAVDRENYILESGSTILTFVAKYLDTLSVGKHKVTLNYTYGSVDTELTIRSSTDLGLSGDSNLTGQNASANFDKTTTLLKSPNTGETSVQTGKHTNIEVWVLTTMLAVAICGVIKWNHDSGRF